MQVFTEAHQEIRSEFHVWKYNGREIDAFRTLNAAEAALRRSLRAGWGERTMYLLDKDGSFLFAGGLATGHTITPETRDAITGLPLDFKVVV